MGASNFNQLLNGAGGLGERSLGPCITLLLKPSWTLPGGRGAGGCRPSQSFWEEVVLASHQPVSPSAAQLKRKCHPETAPADPPTMASSGQEARLAAGVEGEDIGIGWPGSHPGVPKA